MNGDLLKNKEAHVKFYNILVKDYDCKKIQFSNDLILKINEFVKTNNVSNYKFFTGIFALYLSRIDGTEGCILKTNADSIIIIDYVKDDSFKDYLNRVSMACDNPYMYNNEDIDIFYAINDFNNFDSVLTLNIYEDYLELVYNSSIFLKDYINHMASNLSTLISNVLNSPLKSCGKIDLLSDNEKLLIDNFSKGQSLNVGVNKTFSQIFHENAIKTPNKIAIDDGINQVTYQDMDYSSNSIASILQNDYDITPNTFVGLMLPRTYHFPELALAVNKIGAIFVPIEPDYPTKRIEHMLNISNCEYVITTRELSESTDISIDVICMEDLNTINNENIEILSNEEDLLCIIFTSGTMGLPKGVKVSNKQIRGISVSYKNIVNCSGDDIIGCYPSFSFIASSSLYYTLYLGLTCRIYNENEKNDLLLFIESLKENPITGLTLPTVIGSVVFENEDIDLKFIVVAGAKLNEIKNRQSKTKLMNFYGTTEVILSVSNTYDLNNIDDKIPIGKPIGNTWVYILDDNYNQVPIGVPGQICISSEYISPGYLNNDELTNKSFKNNPFSDCESNKRMYCTGDIGYYNFNGEIEIMGRMDDQLSVRGFRIESGEILNIMKSFYQIKDVYLDVDSDNLIAYYTTNKDDLNVNDVKNALKEELPQYMIPSLFIELDKIPLNINGKIDKVALKKISRDNDDVEINDNILKNVVDAYCEVLNLDHVYIDEDFVALGGNSLSTMNLQKVLKDKLNVSLASNKILELSTPFNISNHIKFNLNALGSVEVKYTFEDICPLSKAQLNVYLDESVKYMGTAYNLPFKIKFIKNQYTIDEIKTAIYKLLDIHPILSARVINNKGVLSLVFDAKPQIIVGTINDIDSFVKPFELDDYLSRFLIVETGESILLYVDCHHLIFDGSSINVLLNHLLEILRGGKISSVDNGVLRQISFEESIDSNYINEAKKFFNRMLADQSEVNNLLDSIEIDDSKNNTYINEFHIDENKLGSFLKTLNITPNQFFSSVFAYTLSRFTGSPKVLFNLIEDGRGHVDLIDSVGMFVCTLPLLINCENQKVFSFLTETGNIISSTMKHDLYPFSLLAKEYDLNSSISFQYAHNIFKDSLKQDIVELQHDTVQDLTFYIYNLEKNTLGIKVLHSNKYSRDFVKTFVKTYKAILHEMMIVDNLSEINYVDSIDLEILNNLNKTKHPLRYNDILDAFNENLSKNPNNGLVSYKNNRYNYGEVAFIANKLANLLKDNYVNSQDCVAFLVERSELYLFCILGILSAGAIYVPLDDNHPNERLKFILKDVDAKVVLVSDSTYNRAKSIAKNSCLLNISDILKEETEVLYNLPVIYGDVASILYTSGTTGIPKGVKITRKSILNVSQYYSETYNLTENDVYGLFAAIGFDAASFAINCVIYSGAYLAVIPDDIRMNIVELNKFYIENNVTHSFLTTQVGKLFVQNIENTSLDTLLVGGEKLGEIQSPDNYNLIDIYGPTEAYTFISSINNDDKINYSSLGSWNYNLKVYILDDECRCVPVGGVGELYLSGNQIADGYLNRENETKKAFIYNPFDDDSEHNILYRTGDMVRLLPDGTLGIVGRRDNQVKIRGNRVELLEVEKTIRELSYIDDVTVQTMKNGTNNELIAYVVASDDINNIEDNICNHIAESKPDYMVPAGVIKLDQIPLNVNGKVDKKNLPKELVSSKNVAPKNKTEQEILEICWKLLENTNFGVTDNLLSLGFSSLTYMNLNYEIYSKFKINLNFSELIECKTVRSISEIFSNDNVSKFKKYEKRELYPLTKDQIVVYESRTENPFAFKASYAIKIFDVDVYKLKNALIKFLNRHPFLKSTLTTINGKYYIRREDEWDSSNLIRICKVDESEFELFEEKVVLQENEYIFDRYFKEGLDSYPNNFLYCVLVENKNNVFMSLFLDHLFCDNYSLSLMFNEIDKFYNNQEYKIKEEIIDGFDYNMFYYEDEIQTSDLYDKFKKDVMDYGDLYIPAVREYEDDWCQHNSLSVVLEDKQAIQNFCKKHNLPFNHLFMATFVLALYKYCNLSKGILSVISNGRFFNELMNTQHYIAKTIYLKFKTKSWTSFGDVIDNIDNEMKRIIKSEPNSFKLTYFNQWLFNFIESYENDDLNLTMVDYKKQFKRPSLIKNVGVNFINDVIIFEMRDQYHVNLKYHNMRFTDEYIREFIGYWINIIKYVLLKDEMDLNLEFLDEI